MFLLTDVLVQRVQAQHQVVAVILWSQVVLWEAWHNNTLLCIHTLYKHYWCVTVPSVWGVSLGEYTYLIYAVMTKITAPDKDGQ